MKTIINNKIINLAFIFTIMFKTLNAQMNYWATPPVTMDMRNINITTSALYNNAPNFDTYDVSNGIYSGCGNLLFFIKNTNVYDASGNIVGYLGGQFTNPGNCAENYFQIKGEIAIVPQPGNDTTFYAIYIMTNGQGVGKLFYTKIYATTNHINVINLNFAGIYPCGNGGSNILAYNAFPLDGLGENPGGIAVSTLQSNNVRYLFACGNYGIYRYIISNTGISTGQIIATPNNLNLSANELGTMELELSPDGKYLAFSNYNPVVPGITYKVFYVKLFNFNWAMLPAQPFTLNAIKGIEFDNTSSYLYVSGGTSSSVILAKINISTNTITYLSTGGYDWSNTFLEFAKNNRIIGIVPQSSSSRIIQINPLNGSISASIYTSFDSRHTSPMMGNVYTLPDQIDGENYDNIFPPKVQINSITLNNTNFTGNCDEGGLLTFYNCNPIYLNASYVNNISTPSQYKIEITQYSGCTPLYGSNYLNYSTGWINGAIPSNIDLRTLSDANGNSLYNKTGTFLIKVSVKDGCGNISFKQGYFNSYSTISPNLNLEIYNTYWTDPSNTYLPASQNISNPILTGALTAGFRINNSTGNVTGYNVNIDQVDNTGNLIKNIYNKTYITNNISTVAPQQLNSFCIPSSVWSPYTGINACNSSNPNYSGYTGYWGYSNGLISVGNYYKITITLYNPCSNASNYSYIYVNNGGMKLMENPDTSTKYFKDIFKANIFPNPSKDIINFNIQSEKDDYYTIQIFDLTGRLLFTPFENIFLNSGENNLQCDIRHLNPGTHLCIIRSKNGITKNHLLVVQ